PPVLPSIDSLIHPAGDQDYYRFEAEAGQVVTVDVDSAVFNPDQPPAKIVATLFDGSQTELATSSYLDADQDPFLQMSLPATGTYFLRIRELRGFVGTTNTYYQLGVSLGPANDDDSFANANPVQLPRSVSGTINPSADLDHLGFFLTDTVVLGADVDAREGLQSLLQGTLRLHAAGGEILQDAGSPDPGFSSPLVAGIYSVSLEGSCTGGGCLNEDSYYALYLDADQDGDGLYLPVDNCPGTPNSLQEDSDLDRVGNLCDNCLMEFNPEQSDAEGDGFGDACDCLPLDFGNAPPGEVDAVLATDTGAPLWTTVSFLWDPTATASGYEVHRGTFSTAAAAGSTYNHTTGLDCSPAGLQVEDSDPQNPGQGFYYFFRATNGCGKGPLGMNSQGLLRPDLGACP
ncbi:MAG: PPC domain-containing protein, partial [Acidobacteriota bacterium]